jgi:hypothetical protein
VQLWINFQISRTQGSSRCWRRGRSGLRPARGGGGSLLVEHLRTGQKVNPGLLSLLLCDSLALSTSLAKPGLAPAVLLASAGERETRACERRSFDGELGGVSSAGKKHRGCSLLPPRRQATVQLVEACTMLLLSPALGEACAELSAPSASHSRSLGFFVFTMRASPPPSAAPTSPRRRLADSH